MGYLSGLQEYLDEHYGESVFDQVLNSKEPWEFHVHGGRIIRATVLENVKYDVTVQIEGQPGQEVLPKVQVKCLYSVDLADSIRGSIKTDEKVKALGLEPIFSPNKRYFVKNKSLFPLMKEREVVFFTLLEGEMIRGIIAGFTRYDITVHLKGGKPVMILRHSVYDLRNKKGRCFLKSFQEGHRDWERSPLFVSGRP
jgi:sRNA-binding regulator protein Hfq